MANAIAGSAILLAVGSLIGVPVGIAGGIFLAEFGRGTKLANAVRFTADVLNGVPSIVMGIAVYSLIVVPQGHFSAFSGGVALGIMMIPTVCRTTEEMLLMVPNAVREAALALGVPNWRSVLAITVKPLLPASSRAVCWLCARGRRDGSVDIHGLRECGLERAARRAYRRAAIADLRLCALSLRRLAQAGVGGIAGFDRADRAGGYAGALRHQPWCLKGQAKWASASR